MKLSQVAAQLYTVRDHAKTAADLAVTLQRIRAIGYEAVQLSGVGPIPEAEILSLLRANGLTCCATHEPGQKILEQPQAVVERLRQLQCRYTAYPYPGGYKFETMAEVEQLAAGLDAAGACLRAAGQILTYHNHDMEFRQVNGKSVLAWLYEKTAPVNLQGEIDTYWVTAGGDDPAAWCRRLDQRLPLLHLKDGAPGADGKLQMKEIGSGVLDWPAIIRAAEDSGCQWYIVEQDGNWRDDDPFKSLAISFQYIAANLCR